MPKKVDPALKERALRMVAEHRGDYDSVTAVSKVVAEQLGLGKETVRRWVVQADIDAGARPGTSSEENAEIKKLRAENRLREDNEILRRASIFFAGELDPRNR
jgi:transposase